MDRERKRVMDREWEEGKVWEGEERESEGKGMGGRWRRREGRGS